MNEQVSELSNPQWTCYRFSTVMEDLKSYIGFPHSFMNCWSQRIKWDHPRTEDTGLDGQGRLFGFLFQYLYWVSRKAKKVNRWCDFHHPPQFPMSRGKYCTRAEVLGVAAIILLFITLLAACKNHWWTLMIFHRILWIKIGNEEGLRTLPSIGFING